MQLDIHIFISSSIISAQFSTVLQMHAKRAFNISDLSIMKDGVGSAARQLGDDDDDDYSSSQLQGEHYMYICKRNI